MGRKVSLDLQAHKKSGLTILAHYTLFAPKAASEAAALRASLAACTQAKDEIAERRAALLFQVSTHASTAQPMCARTACAAQPTTRMSS